MKLFFDLFNLAYFLHGGELGLFSAVLKSGNQGGDA